MLDRDFDGFARTSNGMEVAGAGEGTASLPCAGPSWDASSTGPGRSLKRAVMARMVVGAAGSWSRSEERSMGDAFEGGDGDRPCPICRGEASDEFIAMVEQAAAQPGKVMTFDEALAWLRDL